MKCVQDYRLSGFDVLAFVKIRVRKTRRTRVAYVPEFVVF